MSSLLMSVKWFDFRTGLDHRKGMVKYNFCERWLPLDAILIYSGIHELNRLGNPLLRYKDIEGWLKESQLAFGRNKLTTAVELLVEEGLVSKEEREHSRIRVSDPANVPPALEVVLRPYRQMEAF